MKLGIREYAYLAVLVAVPLASWFFVFQPRNTDIVNARREIASMEVTLARLDTLAGTVGDVRASIHEAEGRLADFGRIIPNAEEVEDLLAEMNRIGQRHELSIASIRAIKQTEVQGYIEIPHRVEISGDFEGIYRFLADLERLPRLVRVQSLEIERNLLDAGRVDGERTFGLLDASLVMVVYCDGGEDSEKEQG
ncbi:MAG: type 4a pilus biogenesis protein PilO [Planctomycetota bacterium]|nr:type 4a pilus biogenesis protein PilO [Planctomycetota bacterium]